ncbi:MAG TPA: DUF6174 domain-containing protein [Chloroflexia bacterium]|nr:DUF6174 domain-containing protein [Chloroflexia bacterium]
MDNPGESVGNVAGSTRIARTRKPLVVVRDEEPSLLVRRPNRHTLLGWIILTAVGLLFSAPLAQGLISGTWWSPDDYLWAVISVALGFGFIGAAVGVSQWLVLSYYVRSTRIWLWVPATAASWACMGSLVALVSVSRIMDSDAEVLPEVAPYTVMGAIAGSLFGFFQGRVLAAAGIKRAGWWVVSSALASAAGIGTLIYVFRVSGALHSAGNGSDILGWLGIMLSLTLFGAISGLSLIALLNGLFLRLPERAGSITASVILCGLLIFSIGGPLDNIVHPPRVNITLEDYERALNKWKAQGIQEYEITVDTFAFLGGTSSLRVSDEARKITILRPPEPEWTPEPDILDYVRADTVEGMFEEIKAVLDDAQIFHTPAMGGSGRFYMAYRVEFHPELGYPTRFEGRPVTEPGAYVFDADFAKRVTEFKVLKRGTP